MKNISELFNDRKVNSPSISSGTLTLDLSTGRFFNVSLTANVTTLTISNVPSSVMTSFEVVFTQDSTGSRSVTWPSSFKFSAGSSPKPGRLPSDKACYQFITYDSGTTWICTRAVNSVSALQYSTKLLEYSPTGLYMAEESSGTQMIDSSPNANHGTYYGSLLPTAGGLVTEGSKSILVSNTQYAHIPSAVTPSISGFSIVFWISFTTTSNLIIMEINQNAGYSIQSLDVSTGGAGKIGLVSTTSVAEHILDSSIAINDGLPHCVIFSIGSGQSNCSLFIDGVDRSVRPSIGTLTTTFGSATYWDVGQRAGTFSFGGRYDGVAFVPSLLTLADAKAIYAAGNAW